MMVERRKKSLRPMCVSITFGLGIILGATVLGNSSLWLIGLAALGSMVMFHLIAYKSRMVNHITPHL